MFQPDLLKSRTILITGGGTGLGRSMALRFAELGAQYFSRRPPRRAAEANHHDIRAKGARAAYFSADVRDFAAVESAVAAAEKEFGTVDTLVNNAAGNFIARSEKLSPTRSTPSSASSSQELQLHSRARPQMDRRQTPGNVLNIVTTYAATNSGSGYVDALRLRKSRRPRHDALARRRMGQASHPPQRHRSRPVSPPKALSRA